MNSRELHSLKSEIMAKAKELDRDDDNIQDILFQDRWLGDKTKELLSWLEERFDFEVVEAQKKDPDDDGSNGIYVYSVFKLNGETIRIEGMYYSYDGYSLDVWDWDRVEKKEVRKTEWVKKFN